MWCLAHRLELAIKDALKATYFDKIDEMLLRLYLLYEKSPKKCRELEEIICHLKECLSITKGGTKPVRASGSQWIAHKWGAMKSIISNFGAYTNHLVTLSDATVDRSKLKGYYNRWVDAKYLVGCAVFCDLLSPCVVLSKVMQYDHRDILQTLTAMLRTVKEMDKLSAVDIKKWPTYVSTVEKFTEEDGAVVYQCQELNNVSAAKAYYTNHCAEYCSKVTECIKARLSWSDLQQLRYISFFPCYTRMAKSC